MSNKRYYRGRGSGSGRGRGRSCNAADISVFDIFPSYLIIVESPSKCKKIEEYLGSNYMCIASRGHLRDIRNLASINFSNMENLQKIICGDGCDVGSGGVGGGGVVSGGVGDIINFSIIEDKIQHVEYMRKVIGKFLPQNIYLATDFDREGEAIAWHICDLFGLSVSGTKRIVFTEITKDVICSAVAGCSGHINMALVRSQWCRQIIDIVIGFNISPLLWKYVYTSAGDGGGLSAGRCQTPALRLIYDNYLEIEKRELGKVYKICGVFKLCNENLQKLSIGGEYKFILQKTFDCEEDVRRFMMRSLSPRGYVFNMGEIKKVYKNNSGVLNTSRLLQLASSACSLSTKQIMAYCQILYQDGHITYMRTESTKYSAYFLNKAVGFISSKWGSLYLTGEDELLKMTAGNDEPHEAIRVTSLNNGGILAYDDRRISALYKFIWKTTLQSCMSRSVYKSIDLCVCGGGGGDGGDDGVDGYYYKHNVEKIIFSGWEIVSGVVVDTAGFDLEMYVKTIKKIIPIPINISANLVVENKKSHFTESTLIKKLDDLGIGRPSTYSLFIETIQTRAYVNKMDFGGYIVECKDFYLTFDGVGGCGGGDGVLEIKNQKNIFGKENNKLIIQPLGLLVIDFLIKYFNDLFSYNYTNYIENKLDIISANFNNDFKWVLPCFECYQNIKSNVSGIKNLQKFYIDLGDGYEFVFQKYGAVIRTLNDDGGGDVGGGSLKSVDAVDVEKKQKQKQKQKQKDKYKYIKLPDNFVLNYEKLMKREYLLNDFIPNIKSKTKNLDIKSIVFIEDSGDDSGNEKLAEKFKQVCGGGDGGDDVGGGDDDIVCGGNILRILNSKFSIRKGKYGSYIFYKTTEMKKPEFLKLKFKGFSGIDGDKLWYMNQSVDDVLLWIKENYNVE